MVDADHTVLAPDAEAAQPLYARYWLHNRGPAPLGGLPAVAHLHPPRVIGEPDSRCAAAAHRIQRLQRCRVGTAGCGVVCPEGWAASPAELPFVLPPGEHLETDLEPSTAACGNTRRPVSGAGRARRHRQRRRLDARRVAADGRGRLRRVGRRAERRRRRAAGLIHGAGGRRCHRRRIGAPRIINGTDARTDLAVEAHLISPWGTWEWIGPAAAGATVPAEGERGARIRRIASGVGKPRRVVGAGPRRLRGLADLFARGGGDGPVNAVAAKVGGIPIRVDEVDAREAALRAGPAGTLPPLGCRQRAPARADNCVGG